MSAFSLVKRLRRRTALGVMAAVAWAVAAGSSAGDVMTAGGGTASAGPYAVCDGVGEPVAGTAGVEAYAGFAGFWNTAQAIPVVPVFYLAVRAGKEVLAPAGSLLAAVTDEDDDTVRLAPVDASTPSGGLIAFGEAGIVYRAPVRWEGQDLFHYAVADSGGDVAPGAIWVTVMPAFGGALILVR